MSPLVSAAPSSPKSPVDAKPDERLRAFAWRLHAQTHDAAHIWCAAARPLLQAKQWQRRHPSLTWPEHARWKLRSENEGGHLHVSLFWSLRYSFSKVTKEPEDLVARLMWGVNKPLFFSSGEFLGLDLVEELELACVPLDESPERHRVTDILLQVEPEELLAWVDARV